MGYITLAVSALLTGEESNELHNPYHLGVRRAGKNQKAGEESKRLHNPCCLKATQCSGRCVN